MNAMTRRWLARASFALMLAAVALVIAVAGWRSLALVALNVIGAAPSWRARTGSSRTGACSAGWRSS